ncbi:phage tail assembly protein [Thauera butanivorans]|uniref:phage tail assembly protein n=1 Tax=Thauera butanivorans TaxID=86174 RepID=UPI003AB15BF7
MNRDITIQLDTPLQRGNQTLTEITLRKPNAGELIGISLAAMLQIDVETQATLLPRISTPTLTRPDVLRMDPADLLQLGLVVAAFLTPKPRDAAAPAPAQAETTS